MSFVLLAFQALAGEPDVTPWTTTTAAGVQFRGRIVGGVLHAEAQAPTHGWIAIGLNTKPELDGSLLVMAAVRDGAFTIEEHLARPPAHPRRQDVGATNGLVEASGAEGSGPTTLVRFSIRLDTGDGLVPRCRAGEVTHLTLAWSQEDDFGHHSARREQVPVVFGSG